MAALREREDSPLLNRATQGLYVPGSVFKIVTAIAGLGSGAIGPDTTFEDQPEEYDTGFLVEGFRIRDFPRRVQTDHPLDFYEATEVSSNIWYAHAGLDIGADSMVDWASRVSASASASRSSCPRRPARSTAATGRWPASATEVELANAAYGQAEVLVTPLQMALVASTIANDGLMMKPKLVDELRASDGTVTQLGAAGLVAGDRPGRGAGHRQTRCSAPSRVRYGADLAGAAKVPGVPTAGKSGTAQLGGDAAPHSLVHRLRAGRRATHRDRGHRRGRRRRRPTRRADGRRPHEPSTLASHGDRRDARSRIGRQSSLQPNLVGGRTISRRRPSPGPRRGRGQLIAVDTREARDTWQRSRNRARRSPPTSSA